MDVTKVLSLDDFLGADDSAFREVQTPFGVVKLGNISAEDYIEFIATPPMGGQRREKALQLVARSWVQPDGSRVPEERWVGVVSLMKKKGHKTTDLLVDAMLEHNGIGMKMPQAPQAAPGETVKNS